MATTVVVELTADEQRLLNAFRKAEAADEKLRASLNKTSDTAGKKFTDAFIRGGRNAGKSLNELEKKSKTSFGNIGKTAVKELAAIGTAYFGIQQGIQVVTDALREQQDVLRGAAEGHRSLAAAQQEAFKNLSTLTKEQRTGLLEGFVPKIARDTAFPDLANLTKAVGDAQSAGAQSIEQLQFAVKTAAQLTVNTTEFVDETAAALVDAARATGNINAQQNASQIFLIGAQARIVDPAKLFRNVSPVQIAGSIAAGPRRREEGALEGGALFASLTRVGADPQGDASQTAAVQFIQRMDEFFQNLGKDASKAQAKLGELKKQDPLSSAQRLQLDTLRQNQANQIQNDRLVSGLEKRIASIQNRQDTERLESDEAKRLSVQKRKLGEQLSAARRSEFTPRDEAQLQDLQSKIGDANTKFEAEKSKLEAVIAASKIQGFRGRLPETPAEQLQVFKKIPQLAELFLSDKFGEQRFRPGFQQLVRGGAAFDDFKKTLSLLRAERGSTRLFDEKVQEIRGATAAQEQARLQRIVETNINLRNSFDTVGANIGSIRDEVADTLSRTRSTGPRGIGEALVDTLRFPRFGGIKGGEGIEEVTEGIRILQRRRESLRKGGIEPSEVARVKEVEGAIEGAFARIRSRATLQESPEKLKAIRDNFIGSTQFNQTDENRGLALRIANALNEMIALQREMVESSRKTSQNTAPEPVRTTDAMPAANSAANRRRGAQLMLLIDALVMDNKIGQILKPEPDAIPFRSSVASGVGIQVTSSRGPGFTLTCTTHVDPTLLDVTRQSIVAKLGTLVNLIDYYHGLTIDYASVPHGSLSFAVTQARVIESRNLAAWCGYRLGVYQSFEPAAQIVSQWTMYAVPN